jgi:hypothetical protein
MSDKCKCYEYHVRQIDENRKISTRIDELDILINVLKKSYNNLCATSLRKDPFKCPSCDGIGKRIKPNFQDGGDINFECVSCKGTGIIWN